ANASDATLIRNAIARDLEEAVGVPFAGSGRFVDLYINGDYMGNYYLCPSIEIGTDRVNITDIDISQSKILAKLNSDALIPYETPQVKGWNIPDGTSDITGGYLVEREFGDRYKLEYGEIKNGFITSNDEHFIVTSPQYCSVNEINYISEFFEQAEKEILGQEPLGNIVDIDSFAKRYLVEEVIKNYDGGVSSCYYYKDSDLVDGKLYAGPGWDFDMSLGNYLDWMEYHDEDATGITKLYLSEHSSIYYKKLAQNEDFIGAVKGYYNSTARPFMEYLVEEGIDAYEKELMASAKMDSIRWKDMYAENGYAAGDPKEYEDLKAFIRQRIEFLNKE
ncbi:MAG: CotH kinase family protein, partial [Butyrivibrio sp.]|nr:CotH kinase family protein [Butyrivibrio sp.]